MRLLFDTNAVAAIIRGDEGIIPVMEKSPEHFINVAILAELYHGAFNSERKSANLERIALMLMRMKLLELNRDTARVFGEFKAELQRIGRPIPINDVWIAASAVQHDCTLVTRDRHFQELPQVPKLSW